jgi:hypothetical protein
MIHSMGENSLFIRISWRKVVKRQTSGLMLQHMDGLAGKPIAAGVCQFVL